MSNISYRTEFTAETSICNDIHSCPRLQHLNLSFCKITDVTIEEIVSSCKEFCENFNAS